MNVNYINPFLIAIQNVFKTMIDIPITLGKPLIKKGKAADHEVSGIIGLSGEVTGSVVISLSEKVALRLASAMLHEEITEIEGDGTDAIGEIANMIAGNAKAKFPTDKTTLSVPNVIIGKHKVSYPSGIPIISIPCETESGNVVVDIALKMK
jgi:chemotaxis protein CheX